MKKFLFVFLVLAGTVHGQVIQVAPGIQPYPGDTLPHVFLSEGGVAGFGNISDGSSSAGASLQAQPSNPAATTSASGVMMGLNQVLTPTLGHPILIIISGIVSNTTSVTSFIGIRYGTGTPPINGATYTGANAACCVNAVGISGTWTPFTINAVVTGLSAGTPYWFDLTLSSNGVNSALVNNLFISIIEN